MKPENIISAAQARLNFCNEDYVNLYKEINNKILDKSRTASAIEVNTEVTPQIRDRIIIDLKELGYKAEYWHNKDKIYTIFIRW